MENEVANQKLNKVLNWVNEIRGHIGGQPLSELPKGHPRGPLPLQHVFDIPPVFMAEISVGLITFFSDKEIFLPGVPEVTEEIVKSMKATLGEEEGEQAAKGIKSIDTPDFISQFILDFDNGQYPELIDETLAYHSEESDKDWDYEGDRYWEEGIPFDDDIFYEDDEDDWNPDPYWDWTPNGDDPDDSPDIDDTRTMSGMLW